MIVKNIAVVAITVALELTGLTAYKHITMQIEPVHALPLELRDDWQHPVELNPDLFASGKASWYDASRNNAWYTRESEWGAPVEFYAAAGPDLRDLVQAMFTTKINWGVTMWRNLASKERRPKFIVTSVVTGKSIVVTVTDWCGCYSGTVKDKSDDKIVDLSPSAFMALGLPLSRGVVDVIIEPAR